MTSRRDLLKYFGIGTMIVPVVDGIARAETPAKLIAVPEVAPVEIAEEMPSNPAEFFSGFGTEQVIVDVYVRTKKGMGHLKADSFLTRYEVEAEPPIASRSAAVLRDGLIYGSTIRWRMEGTCKPDGFTTGAPIWWRDRA